MATMNMDALTPEEQRQFAAQFEYAKALRGKGLQTDGQMVSGIYVPKNPWENLVNAGFGAGMERYQTGQQQSLIDSRSKEYDDFISKRPGIYNEQPSMVEQVGPPMQGQQQLPQIAAGPPERVLKGATQMLDEQNKWMGSVGPTTNPLLRSIQQQSVTNDLGWPEKMIALEQAQELKKQLAADKVAADAKIAAEKIERQRQHDESVAATKKATSAAVETQKALDRSIRQQTADAATANAAANTARTVETQANARAKRDDAVKKKDEQKVAFAKGIDRLETLVKDVAATPNLSSALGPIQGTDSRWAPVTMTPFDRSTAIVKIDALKEYLQSKGLEDLRKAGVAPGSVTEKEWSKFAVRLATIERLLPEGDFTKELAGLLKDVQDSRERLNSGKLDEAIVVENGGGAATSGAAAAAAGPRTVVSKHQIIKGPNAGRTGVLWSNGDRTLE